MITDIRLLRNKIIEKQFSRMNDMQFDAVTSVNGPLLILAGAGSGKTTVLVNRIAYLISFGNAYNNDKLRFPLNDEDILEDLPAHNPDWWCRVEDGYILNLKGERKNKIPYDYNS